MFYAAKKSGDRPHNISHKIDSRMIRVNEAMQLATYKFSTEEYHCMGETGILPPNKNFELIRGEIIEKPSTGFKHAYIVRKFIAFSHKKFNATISIKDPILLGTSSEPEPDAILLKPDETFYASRLPQASDALLIVEVSDSTLRYDQTVKLSLYAENQIPEVWIVNIPDQQLEVYRKPDGSNYLQTLILKESETIAPLAFPETEIAVQSILG